MPDGNKLIFPPTAKKIKVVLEYNMAEELLIVGTVAFDSIKTPYGTHEKILGGSGLYASLASSFLAPVNLVSVVGDDFGQENLNFLNKRDINTQGITILPGKQTFHWSGFYEHDMNQAHSLKTDLNVLTEFDHVLPETYRDASFVFWPILIRKFS